MLQGIEHNACAYTLRVLGLSHRQICAEGAKALGLAIGHDTLPSLQELNISNNVELGNDGVTYLAQGLQASSKTKLRSLSLDSVRMDLAGHQSLAELIESGALVHCLTLNACGNLSMPTIALLADPLTSGNLKSVINSELGMSEVEPGDVVSLARSFMNFCPAVKHLILPEAEPGTRQVIKELQESFGKGRDLDISFSDGRSERWRGHIFSP